MGSEAKNILFVGDSLIEFFDWQEEFPEHRVHNLGIAGETVEGLLSRIRRVTQQYPGMQTVVIMAGINNVAMEDIDFIASYERVIEHLSAAYAGAEIIVHSLLPTLVPWISVKSIQGVNLSLRRLAEEKKVLFLDLYRDFIDRQGNPIGNYLLPDGVHISADGYAAWAAALVKILR